jgi:hypothetical protein
MAVAGQQLVGSWHVTEANLNHQIAQSTKGKWCHEAVGQDMFWWVDIMKNESQGQLHQRTMYNQEQQGQASKCSEVTLCSYGLDAATYAMVMAAGEQIQ